MVSVDVVVPCYNYARYLPTCVGSVLSQSGVDVRVLIINDASPDDTRQVADGLAQSDSRIRVIHHETNKGHIFTYNEGLEAANGDYVVLLSADDILTPGALNRATQLMEAHPSVGLVYGHPRTFQGDTVPAPRTGKATWTVWKGDDWLGLMCRSGKNFIICPEVVMRTSVQHQIGGYSSALPYSADMEMWMRAAKVSDIGRVNGTDQAYYRVHSLSMQRSVAGMFFDLKIRLLAYEAVLKEDLTATAKRLLEQARQSIARTALSHATSSIRCDEPLDADVSEYVDFAVAAYPDIAHSRQWRLLQRIRSARPHPITITVARAVRRVRNSLQYRHWRWRGTEW
ncbi:glycosyltransferase family 2 protein [Devosia riboflavina]